MSPVCEAPPVRAVEPVVCRSQRFACYPRSAATRSIQFVLRITEAAMNETCVKTFFLSLVATLLGFHPALAQQRSLYQQTQYKGQEIGKLTGEVYFARMDDYLSVFMVTSEGIVLVEPIGPEMATWLKGALAQRFNVPVRYVIYSHSHWDHASGGAVYADTARFIGQEHRRE